MRNTLFPFQETALVDLHEKISKAHLMWSERDPQVISFSAPTGSGKTIIMTTLFEEILYGSTKSIAEPDSVFVWLSDSPELNEQTHLKIESKSDKIRVRDIVIVDSNFDSEYLEGGTIYFLNTQKIGTDKLLTQKSDVRQYTIWQTLTNTAKRQPQKFYIVIDEAHRGTNTSAQAESKAQSIMQKFIKGSPVDGLCVMPLVIGVTATPQRFDTLITGSASTVQKVIVPPEDVRESGLLKDRIIIHYPDMAINADITMFKAAVENWRQKCHIGRHTANVRTNGMFVQFSWFRWRMVPSGKRRAPTLVLALTCWKNPLDIGFAPVKRCIPLMTKERSPFETLKSRKLRLHALKRMKRQLSSSLR